MKRFFVLLLVVLMAVKYATNDVKARKPVVSYNVQAIQSTPAVKYGQNTQRASQQATQNKKASQRVKAPTKQAAPTPEPTYGPAGAPYGVQYYAAQYPSIFGGPKYGQVPKYGTDPTAGPWRDWYYGGWPNPVKVPYDVPAPPGYYDPAKYGNDKAVGAEGGYAQPDNGFSIGTDGALQQAYGPAGNYGGGGYRYPSYGYGGFGGGGANDWITRLLGETFWRINRGG